MASPTSKASRTAKSGADAAEKSLDAMESAANAAFSNPTFDVPEFVRNFAEQGFTQTREVYARAKNAAEEATDMIESSMEASRESVREVQAKALDIAKANTDAMFELARNLIAATSPAEAFQLQTAFARERLEAFVEYSKDVQASMSKVGAEAANPARSFFGKTLNIGKAA
jgi:phasin